MSKIKEEAKKIIDKLPENVSMEEIIYRLHFTQKLKKANEDIEKGRIIPQEQVKRNLMKKLKEMRENG